MPIVQTSVQFLAQETREFISFRSSFALECNLNAMLLAQHCRRCGKIFCDRCSSYRATLEASEVVRDPAMAADGANHEGPSMQRVCEACFDETNANAEMPARLRRSSSSTVERIVIDEQRLAIPRNLRHQESSSQISDLAEYVIQSMLYFRG